MRGKAMASSGGIAFGAAQKLDERHHFIPEYKISIQYVDKEIVRFQQAIEQAVRTLQHEMKQLSAHHHADDLLPILQTHQMMLQDP